ncbi:MAG TPA: hypothetical protein VHC47_03795 [Mucilaginibacter sp.]|nr:hypothetical protein [Mucilaginibacter sp.]
MRPVRKELPARLFDATVTLAGAEDGILQNALIDTLGNYCSYCEMPLTGFHNEHYRYRAAWEPAVDLNQWQDLLLICADCRSHIQKPVISAEEADNMLWPDLDLTFAPNVQSPLLYELRNVKLFKEDEQGNFGPPEDTQMVFVTTNPASDAETVQRAQNTIDFFQLNMPAVFYNAATNELRLPFAYVQQRLDNRIFKRTDAWFEAQRAVERLNAMDNLGHTEVAGLMKNLLREQIKDHAHFSGNWSVWVTVFDNAGTDDATLRQLFTDDKRYFSGTDEATLFSEK